MYHLNLTKFEAFPLLKIQATKIQSCFKSVCNTEEDIIADLSLSNASGDIQKNKNRAELTQKYKNKKFPDSEYVPCKTISCIDKKSRLELIRLEDIEDLKKANMQQFTQIKLLFSNINQQKNKLDAVESLNEKSQKSLQEIVCQRDQILTKKAILEDRLWILYKDYDQIQCLNDKAHFNLLQPEKSLAKSDFGLFNAHKGRKNEIFLKNKNYDIDYDANNKKIDESIFELETKLAIFKMQNGMICERIDDEEDKLLRNFLNNRVVY